MSERDHIPTISALARVPAERLHPLVEAAMSQDGGLDPATLRELLTLQREWQAEEARRAYTTALVALKRDLPAVLDRDQLVSFKGVAYRHTSLAAALDAVTGPLQAHGFSASWHPSTDKGQVSVSCRLTHAGGHSEEVTLAAPPDTSGHKSPAQSVASTITLLERYTLLALLGIATADMQEDGDEHSIDAARNLRAVATLCAAGIPLPEAEGAAGAPCAEWTRAHLYLLRDLVRARRATSRRPQADTLDAEAVPEPERNGPTSTPEGAHGVLDGIPDPDEV